MTKNAPIGSVNCNLLKIGNNSSPRKLAKQTKGDGLEFPDLISQQDTNMALRKCSNGKSDHNRIADEDNIFVAQIEKVEQFEDIGTSDKNGAEVQDVCTFLTELRDNISTSDLQQKSEAHFDVSALWQHLNGYHGKPEVIETQSTLRSLKLDLPHLVTGEKQSTIGETELNSAAAKKAPVIISESVKANSTLKLPKGIEKEGTRLTEGVEDIRIEKPLVKVIGAETHFSFSNTPSPGLQLAGAITESFQSEVHRLKAGNSKLLIDPNAVIVKSLRIQLIPENLGELKVLMQLRGSELTMNIEVSSNSAATKLTDDKDLLKDLLEQAGFEMASDPVLIIVRSDQPANGDTKMNDQAQNKQLTNDGNAQSYGKHFGDGNERQHKQDQARSTEKSPPQPMQELVETTLSRNDRNLNSNSSSSLYL